VVKTFAGHGGRQLMFVKGGVFRQFWGKERGVDKQAHGEKRKRVILIRVDLLFFLILNALTFDGQQGILYFGPERIDDGVDTGQGSGLNA